MSSGYETVIDPSTVIWTLAAMLIHGFMLAIQLAMIAYLIATAVVSLLTLDEDSAWLRRLGLTSFAGMTGPTMAAVRFGLALLLAIPLGLGTSLAPSLAACIGVVVLLTTYERGLPVEARVTGRYARHTVIAAATLLALFMLWEREDPLALGTELIVTANGWRMQELDWQLTNDLRTPKVGDLAPDFALQDPTGKVNVRLSDFRGKRPVALVFGSYT